MQCHSMDTTLKVYLEKYGGQWCRKPVSTVLYRSKIYRVFAFTLFNSLWCSTKPCSVKLTSLWAKDAHRLIICRGWGHCYPPKWFSTSILSLPLFPFYSNMLFLQCIQFNGCFLCKCLVMSYVIHMFFSIQFLLLEFILYTLVVDGSNKPRTSFEVIDSNLLLTKYPWNLNTLQKFTINFI